MGDDAFVPLHIVKLLPTSITIIARMIVIDVGMFDGLTVLPLYMQIVHGISLIQVGSHDAGDNGRDLF